MTKQLLKVIPDYKELQAACPNTSATALIQGEDCVLNPIKNEFRFPENKDGLTPFYTFTEDQVTELNIASEKVYNLVVDSLDFLFSDKYKHLIPEFFGREFISKYPEFVEYAAYTFKKEHPAIYGRFDIAYDFEEKKILGFYEGNLDTPTMYFDSVVMQNHLMKKLGMEDKQFNLHQEKLGKNINKCIGSASKRIAFLCDTTLFEDCITTELLFHTINDNTDHIVNFADMFSLEYDYTSPRYPVFTLDDMPCDYVFALYPWEDMIVDFYDDSINPLKEWQKWADRTKFLEPAWRWFVSNKGIWAWVTYLKEVLAKTDETVAKYIDENVDAFNYVIPSFNHKPKHLKNFVMKPLQGRMSNNIMFYENNVKVHDTDGFYSEDDFMYQELCPTTSADGGQTSAIVCTWLAPWNEGGPMDMEASGIAVREFTGMILKVSEERFVPHLVADE